MLRTQSQSQSKAPDAPRGLLQSGLLQRKCDCGQHTIARGECKECNKNGQTAQRATRNSELGTQTAGAAPPIVNDVSRSSGQGLDAGERSFFEARFAHDFSHVRVHTDAKAAESARSVNASAYTVGADIVFANGQYAPHTRAGKQLLAHELTHVVQQRGRLQFSSDSPALEIGPEDDQLEREADSAARKINENEDENPAVPQRAPASRLQRHVGAGLQRKVLRRSPGGLLSNIGRGIAGFFGFSVGFDDEDLQKYLEHLEKTGKPEKDFDSDNKAVGVVDKWRAGGDKKKVTIGKKTFDLSIDMKVILIEDLLDGYVGEDDEVSVHDLLARSDLSDAVAIIARIGEATLMKHDKIAAFLKTLPARLKEAAGKGETIKKEDETPPDCGKTEFFTMIKMPLFIPNNYLRESNLLKKKEDWEKQLAKEREEHCEAIGTFSDVSIKWDLGNPKLGKFWTVDINKNDLTFDIIPHVLFDRKPCCSDFAGSANWSFNVEAKREKKTESGKTTSLEQGKTTAPLIGNVQTSAGAGRKCCTIKRELDLDMLSGNNDKEDQIDIRTFGKVSIVGANFSG